MTAKKMVPGAWAFLMAAFFNAFLDLGHKVTVQNTLYKVYDGNEQAVYTAILNSLILLPFIFLFSPSGFVSDRFAKHKVMLYSAYSSLILSLIITLSYAQGWFWVAFAMTFLMGVQSAFYSPAKYGYIKELFGKEMLAPANGWVQAVSICAVLLGLFAFSLGFKELYNGGEDKNTIISTLQPLGWFLVLISLIEIVLLHRLPARYEGDKERVFNLKKYLSFSEAREMLRPLKDRVGIRQSMIGLAVFWSIGQTLLAVIPAFVKDISPESDVDVANGVLACIAIGIALGSWVAGRLSKHHIEMGLIPVGAAGFSFFLWLLPFSSSPFEMALLFLAIGFVGGLLIVPLNALIQFHSAKDELGQMLATNNFIQNLSMLVFLILYIVATIVFNLSPQQALIITALVAVVGCGYTLCRLPQSFVRFLLTALLSQRYKVIVQGMKNLPSTGGVLLLGNHISWIDWAIVQLASPRPVRFVMLKSIYDRWYLRWFFKMFGSVPISPGAGSQSALDEISNLLAQGEVACLFPEGSISRNGQLGEFKKGFERALKNAGDVTVIPFYLRGLWGSQFSRSSEHFKKQRKSRLKRDIIVAFGQPVPTDISADKLKQRVFDISIDSWQAYASDLPNLGRAWVQAVKREPSGIAMVDGSHKPLSPAKALATAITLSKHVKTNCPDDAVGLLLPTSMGGVLANMAATIAGKIIVNLNYTASVDAILYAMDQSKITIIYTSKRFVKKLEQKGVDVEKMLANRAVLYLEDIFEALNKKAIIGRFLVVRLLPAWLLSAMYVSSKPSDSTAVIIFTSGSEGLPKGVQLSHANILANLKQISEVFDPQEDDVILACLPLFHAFGLTVTQFMPLIESIPMVCHPDPTDAPGMAKMVAKYRATMMCSTSTFLRLYCKNNRVHPLMFESLRVVVAGAERLNPQIRDAFALKFNKAIYEGYGATETTPVASVNIPDRLSFSDWTVQKGNKLGTVGLPLPGTSFKIVDPNTFEELPTGEEGMILVGGAQVMQGYLDNPEKTQSVIKELDGIRWYVSGDKGKLDSDGFLTIVDRYSRFAKVGGEMISLGAVEAAIFDVLESDEIEIVAVGLPDDKKGEKVVVLSSHDLDYSELKQKLLASGINPLLIPAELFCVVEVPKLGSGKVDFSWSKKLAAELAS